MTNNLFEAHLEQSLRASAMDSKSFLCNENDAEIAQKVELLLSNFAEGIDEDDDLGTAWDLWIEYQELSEADSNFLFNVLVQTVQEAGGDGSDEEDVKSFL